MARPATWTQIVSSTSMGTGVAETRLNGDTSFVVPAQARSMIEFKPYQAATGAITAAQSFFAKFKVKSQSIGGLEPKEVVIAPFGAGLGATYHAQTPVLKAFRIARNLPGANVNIDFYGQYLVANTVAGRGGAGVKLSTNPVDGRERGGKEQFWFGPTDETDTGTTAATITGGTFTINGASCITDWYGHMAPAGTITASESFVGYARMESSDFQSVQKVEWPMYPITASLSTLIGLTTPDQNWEHGEIPINPTTNIQTYFVQEETLTTAGDFWIGCGFVR